MTSWAMPVNFMANTLDNIQQDPKANKIMLGIGLAYDTMRNVPVDLYANIPHFESEVDGSVAANSPAGGSTG
jgi:hypothetical protein